MDKIDYLAKSNFRLTAKMTRITSAPIANNEIRVNIRSPEITVE